MFMVHCSSHRGSNLLSAYHAIVATSSVVWRRSPVTSLGAVNYLSSPISTLLFSLDNPPWFFLFGAEGRIGRF